MIRELSYVCADIYSSNRMKHLFTYILTAIAFVGLSVSVLTSPVSAYSASEYSVADVSMWRIGMLASLDDDGAIAMSSGGNKGYIGVVTTVNSASIDVASSGTVQVLVTDENGTIEKGARLQVSDIAGIASRESNGAAIGVVKTAPVEWKSVQTQSGRDKPIKLGVSLVQLLESASGGASSDSNPFLAAVQNTGNGVAGRDVDMWRIITALIIGFGGLILSFGLLFVSSRESFFSMGRNPMAGGMIMKGLWKIVALSVAIMCVSLLAAYAMLKLG
jgi:hypothetical protein